MGPSAAAEQLPPLKFTPRSESLMNNIVAPIDERAQAHKLARTKSQEVVAKGGRDRVRFDGATPIPAAARGRRGSLTVLLEGCDDEFSTHEALTQRVAMASASLGALRPQRTLGVVGRAWQRLWMPIIMLLLGIAVLFVPLHAAVLEHSPNAWSEAGDAAAGDDESAVELLQRFEVNEPVGAFLGVTALVYALIFAAAYSEAHSRLDEIRTSLTLEASGVHTAMLLARSLDAGNAAHQTRVLLLFAAYIEQLSDEIAAGCTGVLEESGGSSSPSVPSSSGCSSSIETLYAAIPYLSKICNDGENDEMDRLLVQRTIDMINKVSEARSIRETATHNGLSWITLLFLLEMALITFVGVTLLQNGSRVLNIMLPVLTLIALVSSVLFLADLALPFSGVVQVDTSIFDRIRNSIAEVLAEVAGDQCRTLWVGRIPRSMIDCGDIGLAADRVRGLFTRFGKVRSVTIRKKPAEYGTWALVSFESEISAERALVDEAGVCWKSDERLELRKAKLSNASGGGVAKQIIAQHNNVDDAAARVSSEEHFGGGEAAALSKNYAATPAGIANESLPGTVPAVSVAETAAAAAAAAAAVPVAVSGEASGGGRRMSSESKPVGVTIDSENHLEVAQQLARRRSRRASIV
jgi:hypothetical protein